MTYREYINSTEWFVLRRVKLDQAEHRCQLCNAAGTLHVHHRTYERLGQEKLTDLVVLCEKCHERFHFPEPDENSGIAFQFRLDDGTLGRLKKKDVEFWQGTFTSLDVEHVLSGLAKHSQVKPFRKKNWFFHVSGALKKENEQSI